MYSFDRGRTIQLMFSRAPGLEPCQPLESMYSAEDLSVSTPGWHWCYYTTVYCAAVDVVTTTVTTLTAPRLHRENCGQVLLVPVLVVVVYSRMDLDDVERLTFLWFSLSVISSYRKLPESRKYLRPRAIRTDQGWISFREPGGGEDKEFMGAKTGLIHNR